MNRVIMMKDRRLIEALDYIDDEYIASAALYKMRAYAESARPLAQTAGQSIKKHWKHYLGFVACLLVLALATPLFTHLPEIISSFAAGWGEVEYSEIKIDLCLANVDYSRFIPEFIDEINTAWKEFRGKDEVLFKDLDAVKFQNHARYLGTYNGYSIIAYDLSNKITGYEQFCYTANLGLYTVESFAYKDGSFITLSELYESGNISYLDLCKIFDKSYEMLDYYQITRDTEERIKLTVPQMPELKLNQRIEKKILEALKEHMPKFHNTEFKTYEAYITDYYGSYNGAYVFKYKSPEVTYNFSFDDYYYETVEDINFLYRYNPVNHPYSFDNVGSGTRIYVYYDGEIFSLSYAYTKGILSYDDIKTIKNYHTMYFPYMIDEFLEDEEYKKHMTINTLN
ncbi:MAG: hypothetical protein J6S14_04275 [Clostridia bacterium]|nr:hypothetical protein [Clostridia bacterium]